VQILSAAAVRTGAPVDIALQVADVHSQLPACMHACMHACMLCLIECHYTVLAMLLCVLQTSRSALRT